MANYTKTTIGKENRILKIIFYAQFCTSHCTIIQSTKAYIMCQWHMFSTDRSKAEKWA